MPAGRTPLNGRQGQKRATHAKLWFVNLYDYISLPDVEVGRYERGERKAAKRIKDIARFKAESFHWPYKPRMADELELGDWIIQAITHKDKTTTVYPPGRFLFMDSYIRDKKSGKQRFVFHLEVPRRGDTMTWAQFREKNRSFFMRAKSPRTKPVRDLQTADDMLALWTRIGRISRR